MAVQRGIIDKAADQCVRAIIYGGAIKATRYVSPTMTVKATRKLYGKKRKPSQKSIEIILTAGKDCKASVNAVINTAAMMAPVVLPSPPSTTITRMSNDFRKLKVSGLII